MAGQVGVASIATNINTYVDARLEVQRKQFEDALVFAINKTTAAMKKMLLKSIKR